MSYLKPALPLNTVSEVTILKRKGLVDGQFGPKMQYTMQYQGTVYDHEASKFEESNGLASMMEGETVHAKKMPNTKGKGEIIFWALANGAESRAMAQPVSNLQQDRNNKAATEYEQAKAEKEKADKEYWAKKDIGASLGMLVKIGMGVEGDFDKALALAKKWRPLFIAAVNEQYMLDVVGANKSSPAPTEKVHLPDHVASAFGEDVSPTL